jgi:hypothetical protein
MTNNFSSPALSNFRVHNGRLDEAQEQGKRVAAASAQSGSTAAQRGGAGRSGAPRGGVAPYGVRMEAAPGARRRLGCAEQWGTRTPRAAGRCHARPTGAGAAGGGARARVRNRIVDPAAHRQAHQGAVQLLIQHQPSLTAFSGHGLELPAAGETRATARREGDRAMEGQTLAGAKKTPLPRSEPSSS